MQAGSTDEQVQETLLGSAEYFTNRGGGTNAGFLTALFLDLLNRAPNQTDLNFYENLLNGTTTRAQVATLILGTSEYFNDLVTSYYSQFLHVLPDAGGLAGFTKALMGGATDETVIADILGSPRFGATVPQMLTLTVAVASTTSMLQRSSPVMLAMAIPLGLLGFLPLVGKNRKRLRLYLGIFALALTAAGAITGCTSSSNTTNLPPAGIQTIVLNATGNGGVVHALNLKINITN
jgi:hypothetical protein